MALKRGDVVVVAYGELGRPRPAVIVQADEFGEDSTTILACPITSEVVEKLAVRPIVDATDGNGLRIRSLIMTDRMLAIPRDRVRQVIGAIDPVTAGRLDTAMLLVFGLGR
jgi:mRNA interferase MazF